MSTKKNWTENAVDFGTYGINKCLNLLIKNNMRYQITVNQDLVKKDPTKWTPADFLYDKSSEDLWLYKYMYIREYDNFLEIQELEQKAKELWYSLTKNIWNT